MHARTASLPDSTVSFAADGGYHPLSSRSEAVTTLSIQTGVTYLAVCAFLSMGAARTVAAQQGDVFDRVTHGYAVSDGGVKIHYATLGSGPLVVMIHGFPDFWYSWRHQMDGAVGPVPGRRHRPARLQPERQADRASRTTTCGCWWGTSRRSSGTSERDKATIVGHDWGGVVAWQFAMSQPQMTENLVILNLPHPSGLLRELRTNPEQIANSEYARTFQEKTLEGSRCLLRHADDCRRPCSGG